jgi:MSHA biogenesis protein MshN
MSLLNDMLRDLSQHKPTADSFKAYDDALLKSSSFSQKKKQSWGQLVLLFIVIFCAVLSVNYFMHKFSAKAKPAAVTPQTIVPAQAAVTAAITTPTKIANATTSLPETKTETVVIPDEQLITVEVQNHINDLLQQAERAMGMDRLTAPVEDNAYGYYQKILSIDENNFDAKEGLDKIASRYLIKAQEQVQLGNSQQAEALVQRARFVSARFVQAHEISIGETKNQVVAELNASSPKETQESQQLVKAPAETIKPFAVAEAPVISVAPNAGWKDEQLAQHAQELIQQNKQAEALALLKAFVASEKQPALSAALLADLYIQQGNMQAAGIVIDKTNYLPVDTKAKLKAQILSANGENTEAITLLEQNLNAADTNESYRSLLASLYHKTANYQQSITSYQRLINSFGEKPAYWLGLALAYDGLSQHKSALQAYQRLREYPQLQEQVKKYTDQRIAALRSE